MGEGKNQNGLEDRASAAHRERSRRAADEFEERRRNELARVAQLLQEECGVTFDTMPTSLPVQVDGLKFDYRRGIDGLMVELTGECSHCGHKRLIWHRLHRSDAETLLETLGAALATKHGIDPKFCNFCASSEGEVGLSSRLANLEARLVDLLVVLRWTWGDEGYPLEGWPDVTAGDVAQAGDRLREWFAERRGAR